MALLLRAVIFSNILYAMGSKQCKDMSDNAIRITDLFDGKKDIFFEDFVLLTYNKDQRPSCNGKEALFNFPGWIRLLSGRIHIKSPFVLTKPFKLLFSIKKNSLLVGSVCEKGHSVNSFVPEEICSYDVLSRTGVDVWKIFEEVRVHDIHEMPRELTSMNKISSDNSPYIEGEWNIEVRIQHGSEVVAGFRIGKPGEWLAVSNADKHQEL